MAYVWVPLNEESAGGNLKTSVLMKTLFRKIFTSENLFALLLCLIVIAIIILTADQAPQWIYQGF